VQSSSGCDNELWGSIKCWEAIEWLHKSGRSSSAQLHRVSYAYFPCVGSCFVLCSLSHIDCL
jgi:hypothetical protein